MSARRFATTHVDERLLVDEPCAQPGELSVGELSRHGDARAMAQDEAEDYADSRHRRECATDHDAPHDGPRAIFHLSPACRGRMYREVDAVTT